MSSAADFEGRSRDFWKSRRRRRSKRFRRRKRGRLGIERMVCVDGEEVKLQGKLWMT